MGDDIKPVPPVSRIQPEFPPKIPDSTDVAGKRHAPAKTPHTPKTGGYDLSAISAEQAQQLLSMPLMQDADALSSASFQALKDAVERRANNKPAEQGDIATLITASQRVEGLIKSTYAPTRAGEPLAKPTSGEVLSKIEAFNVIASSFGRPRDIMIG